MKTLTKCTRVYRCDTCKTQYTSKKSAQNCESRILEEKVFKIGDEIKNKEPRHCNISGAGKNNRGYIFKGIVKRIIGPLPTDEEYEIKWLGGKRLNYHVFEYEVSFKCPLCKQRKSARYYAPELELISR